MLLLLLHLSKSTSLQCTSLTQQQQHLPVPPFILLLVHCLRAQRSRLPTHVQHRHGRARDQRVFKQRDNLDRQRRAQHLHLHQYGWGRRRDSHNLVQRTERLLELIHERAPTIHILLDGGPGTGHDLHGEWDLWRLGGPLQ